MVLERGGTIRFSTGKTPVLLPTVPVSVVLLISAIYLSYYPVLSLSVSWFWSGVCWYRLEVKINDRVFRDTSLYQGGFLTGGGFLMLWETPNQEGRQTRESFSTHYKRWGKVPRFLVLCKGVSGLSTETVMWSESDQLKGLPSPFSMS